jgi:hypothetical protein
MFERVKRAIVVAIVALALAVTSVAASNGEGEIPTFDTWLQGASGPLASIIVGFVISLIADVVPRYTDLPAKWKRAVYFGLCLATPVGAACLRAALGYVAWSFDPLVWHALWAGFGAGLAGTVVHARKRAVMTLATSSGPVAR